MTTIRELLTKIGFDVDTKPLDVFNNAMTNVKHSLIAVGSLTAGVAGGLFGLVKNVSNVGDEIAKSSKELGLSTDALQEWRYVADQSGLGQDELAQSLKIFTRNLGDAATKGTGPFIDRIRQMGLSLVDGNNKLKSTDDLILEIADSLENTKDAATIGVTGFDLFGRGGLRTANALAKGGVEMINMRLRAHELGLVLSNETILAAEKFNDEFHDTLGVVASVKNLVGAGLMPVVKQLMERFRGWVLVNRELIVQNLAKTIERLTYALSFMWNIMGKVGDAFEWFSSKVGGTENALYSLLGVFLLFKLSPLILLILSVARAITTLTAAALGAQAALIALPLLIVGAVATIVYAGGKVLEFFGYIKKGSEESISWVEALITGFAALATGVAFIAAFKFGRLVGELMYLTGAVVEAVLGFVALNAAILFWPAVIAVMIYGFYKLGELLFEWVTGTELSIKNVMKAWSDFTNWFSDILDTIDAYLSNLTWDKFADGLKSWVESITQWVSDKFDEMIDSVVKKFEALVDKVQEYNPFASDKEKADAKQRTEKLAMLDYQGVLPLPTDYKPNIIKPNTDANLYPGEDNTVLDERQAKINIEKKQMLNNFWHGIGNEAQQIALAPNTINNQITNTNSPVTNTNKPSIGDVNVNVAVNLPPGTPTSDVDSISQGAMSWADEAQRTIESVLFNNTEQE